MASQRVTIKPITATLPTGTLSRRLSHQGECPQTLEHNHEIRSPAFDLDPAHELIIPVDPEILSIKAKVNRDPAYILEVLTDKQESFTRNDVIRGLVKYLDDPFLVSGAIDNITRSPDWVEIQTEPSPLFTTRKMLAMKATLADHVLSLSKTTDKGIPSRHINAAIARQNRVLNAKIGASLSNEQETAIRHCLKPARISVVVGLAGAGKSTMLSAVKQAYESSGYRVRGAALSGKAADGLESASGIKCRTLASFEYSWKNEVNQFTSNDVLVVDEAGMIGTRQLLRFVEEVQETGAKIILVGDSEQLQPINAGTPFKDIVDKIDTAQLTEIHRQKSEWQKRASLEFAQGRVEQALNAYELHGHVKEARDTPAAILNLVEDYMKDISNNTGASSRLALAYRRKDVHAINQSIRAALKDSGELINEITVQTIHGKRAFASKDRIMFTKKDRALAIQNGIFGTVQSVGANKITVLIDADGAQGLRTITINPKLYPHFDHGYASTIHKSQGATVDRAFVLGSGLMDRHLAYVAMTRHREETTLYGDRSSLQKMRHLGEEKSQTRQQNLAHTSRQTRGPTMH